MYSVNIFDVFNHKKYLEKVWKSRQTLGWWNLKLAFLRFF